LLIALLILIQKLQNSKLVYDRLPSLQRKTTEKKREKHSGQLHRELFTVFSHLKQPTFSMTRIVIGSFQRLLNKLRDVLRLPGKPVIPFL